MIEIMDEYDEFDELEEMLADPEWGEGREMDVTGG